MKTNSIAGSSRERVATLSNLPEVTRLTGLWNKVRTGAASQEERKEFDSLTKRARDLDPNVLVD